MKYLPILAASAILMLALCGELTATAGDPQPTGDPVIITTLLSDGSTNTWTQADLIAALQLLNRKYHRDVQSADGRKAWHGKKVREIVDTNTLEKVTVYEDGMAFTDPAKIVTPADSIATYNAHLPPPVMTNGVPARLAAARLRQRENSSTTNVVNVTISGGGSL